MVVVTKDTLLLTFVGSLYVGRISVEELLNSRICRWRCGEKYLSCF